jgi:signal transduction histidine kinase
LRTLPDKLMALRIDRGAVILESLLFVVVYLGVRFAAGAGSPLGTLVENISILVASATAALWVLRSVPEMPMGARRAWRVLGMAQGAWFAGDFLMGYLHWLIPQVGSVVRAASLFFVAAYLLAAFALFLFPFASQHGPTRFRYILDAVISAGAAFTLGSLVFVRPLTTSSGLLNSLMPIGFPIGDCILLIVLANLALVNWVPRRTAAILGVAWIAVLISDYLHASLLLLGTYEAGSLAGIGWIAGPLVIGCGSVYERGSDRGEPRGREAVRFDVGVRFQRVLPIALELVLFWYVLTDWRLRGTFSAFGLWTSVVLGVMLIVRLGIRAGEAELDQYWRLFNSLADPSFIADSDGRILLANPACTDLLNAARRTEPRRASLIDVFEGVSVESLVQAARSGQTLNAGLRDPATPYLLTLSPIPAENGRVLIAGVAHDVSEQRRQSDTIQSAYNELQVVHSQLEELNAQLERRVQERTHTLQKAYDQLEQQNRALQGLDQMKTDFVSMVSHELRAPLTNLGGGVELLLSRHQSPSNSKTLTSIQAEIGRLTRFVQTILSVSAMEAGKLVLHPSTVSLPVLTHAARNGWCNLPEFDRIEIEVQDDLPLVVADEEALRSVLGHLLDNALKYAPEGPVRIAARVQEGRVRVDVQDFGPGIPEDKRGLLFQRFQRLDARDSQVVYGYGLGLYLCRRLLRAMGSDLQFQSPAEGGARFSFDLEAAR